VAAATVDHLAEAGDAFYAREILALLNPMAELLFVWDVK
jgi:hypothetical protein